LRVLVHNRYSITKLYVCIQFEGRLVCSEVWCVYIYLITIRYSHRFLIFQYKELSQNYYETTNKMESNALKSLKNEKKRLEKQVEQSENLILNSQACSELVEYVTSTDDPLINSAGNPYTEKLKGGGCTLL